MAAAELIRILEEDTDLGVLLEGERGKHAREQALARVADFSGEPDPDWPHPPEAGIGLLVLDGVLIRRVEIDRRVGAELLGRGDLIRPWDDEEASYSIPRSSDWRALSAVAPRCSTTSSHAASRRSRRYTRG